MATAPTICRQCFADEDGVVDALARTPGAYLALHSARPADPPLIPSHPAWGKVVVWRVAAFAEGTLIAAGDEVSGLRRRAVDDFDAIRSRMEELRKQQPRKDAIKRGGKFCAWCGAKDPEEGRRICSGACGC